MRCVASCRVWQAFAVSWVCARSHKKPTGRRQATGQREIVGEREEIRRRVLAPACNIPVVRKKVEGRRAFYSLAVK